MAGYTKADYDSLYSIRVRVWDETLKGYKRSPIRLNYHRAVMQEMVQAHWDKIVPLLGLTAADRVVVVGAGYGWGVERLVTLTGCLAIGLDIAPYVSSSKGLTEEDEINAAIIAAGYSPTSGHGLEVKNAVFTAEPKAKQVILAEDMMSAESRNEVRKALGGQLPTWIITEDMLSDFNDTQLLQWKLEADKLGVPICHLLRENFPPNAKTAEQWRLLTGHIIITVGAYRKVS